MSIEFSEVSNSGTVYTPKQFLKELSREKLIAAKYGKKKNVYNLGKKDYYPVYVNFYTTADIKIKEGRSNKKAAFIMSGVDMMGAKVAIIKPNIEPFVVVKVTNEFIKKNKGGKGKTVVDYEGFFDHVVMKMRERNKYAVNMTYESMKLYDYHRFQTKKSAYIKIFFDTIVARSIAIKTLTREKFIKGEDDYDYCSLYLRHNLDTPIDTWTMIPVGTNEYKGDYFRDDVYDKIFLLQSDHIFKNIDPSIFKHKDYTLTNAWDIETKKIGKDLTIPKPGSNYYISAISSTISTHFDYNPLVSVVFTTINVRPKHLRVKDKIVPILVTCSDECELLTTYYKYIEIMRPEFEHAFNGGSFDYPIMKDRTDYWTYCQLLEFNSPFRINMEGMSRKTLTVFDNFMKAYCHTTEPVPVSFKAFSNKFPVTESSVAADTKKFYKTVAIKLEATRTIKVDLPKFFGSVHFDTQPLLIKAYPTIELKKLESYLQNAGLGTKEDMNYTDMHWVTAETEIIDPETGEYSYNEVSDNLSEYTIDMVCKFLYYSYIDSLKLHWLLHKESFIMSKRALAALGRFPVADTYFRADGAVLMNMMARKAYESGRCVSVLNKESDDDEDDENATEESFSGAYVVPPKIGLHTDRPITGIDFSSLYPSLMATFNLSPDMVVDPDKVEYYKSLGYSILSLEIPYNICKKGKKKDKNSIVRTEICHAHFIQHNGIIDPEKDKYITLEHLKNMRWKYGDRVVLEYSNVPMKETLEFRKKATVALKQMGYIEKELTYESSINKVYGRAPLKNEQMGVNAKLGQELFNMRNEIKVPFAAVKDAMEFLHSQGLTECLWDDVNYRIVKEGGRLVTIQELKEMFVSLNSKQLAIKIMANTIYGKSGQSILFVYALEVAAGITFTGQNMATKPMIELVEKKLNCEVMYGDTDSLYIKCPWQIYEDIIDRYKKIRFERFGISHDTSINIHEYKLSDEEVELKIKELWEPMIHETRVYISFVTEAVADTLCGMNNTRFLKMSYEEVGFPTYLGGKKKYALIAHEKYINFFPKEIFTRGFDFKKRGQTPIAKKIGISFLRKILHPGFNGDTIGLLKQTLVEFSKTSNIDDFVIFRSYNPLKATTEINTIVNYMTEKHNKLIKEEDFVGAELYTPPIPGESFPYVYVNRQRGYSVTGKVDAKFSAADLAEPYKVVSALKGIHTINLNRYLEKMKGTLGRFIIAEKMFDHVVPEMEVYEDPKEYHQRLLDAGFRVSPPENWETLVEYYDRIREERVKDTNDTTIDVLPSPKIEDPDNYFKRVDKARTAASHKYILNLFTAMTEGFKDFDSDRKQAAKIARMIKKGQVSLFDNLRQLVDAIVKGRYSPMMLETIYETMNQEIDIDIIKYPVLSGLSRGLNTSDSEIKEYYESRDQLLRNTTTIMMESFITAMEANGMSVSDSGDKMDIAVNDITQGAIIIHKGSPHVHDPKSGLMNKLANVLDLIRGSILCMREYRLVAIKKMDLSILLRPQEKKNIIEKKIKTKSGYDTAMKKGHVECEDYNNFHDSLDKLDFINRNIGDTSVKFI